MTVGDLRRALEGLPGSMEVVLEISAEEPDVFLQSDLESVGVEERCDEIARLYLSGDVDPIEEESRS